MAFSTHGNVSPENLDDFQTDYFRNVWSGKKDLTVFGALEQFKVGALIRKLIISRHGMLSRKYKSGETAFFSVNESSNIQSLKLLTAGMYPAYTGFSINQTDVVNTLPKVEIPEVTNELDLLMFNSMPHAKTVIPISVLPSDDLTWNTHKPTVCEGTGAMLSNNKISRQANRTLNVFSDQWFRKLAFPLGLTNTTNFTHIDYLVDLCEQIDSTCRDRKDFLTLENTVNITELKNSCDTVFYDYYYKILQNDLSEYPTDKNVLTKIYISRVMRKMINKIERIILQLRLSAHPKDMHEYDTTSYDLYSVDKLHFAAVMKYFNITMRSKMYAPQPNSLLSVEIYRKPDASQELIDNDFVVSIIHNERQIKLIYYHEFKEAVLRDLATDDSIHDFCGVPIKDAALKFYCKIITLIILVLAGYIAWLLLECSISEIKGWFSSLVTRFNNRLRYEEDDDEEEDEYSDDVVGRKESEKNKEGEKSGVEESEDEEEESDEAEEDEEEEEEGSETEKNKGNDGEKEKSNEKKKIKEQNQTTESNQSKSRKSLKSKASKDIKSNNSKGDDSYRSHKKGEDVSNKIGPTTNQTVKIEVKDCDSIPENNL
eukprot:CAMPEP_0170536288 /NCGR_PEP_ID=MMETSP0209-20121228/102065_1 /TAXON_ID=665100 ORGANISM="Litonotus pictus, Strain P1" /NCGR_SAMPLE_ID=MMETSP0209 /ASSEMBLY_ACC=CAM_ASM_000301 /LENGTH=597 /DNA_ID=CAMNT_0010837637 /DNA_START=205 /DNA_END=1998 /DNA_ORIENTATION=+